jgi:hypothetical protein
MNGCNALDRVRNGTGEYIALDRMKNGAGEYSPLDKMKNGILENIFLWIG